MGIAKRRWEGNVFAFCVVNNNLFVFSFFRLKKWRQAQSEKEEAKPKDIQPPKMQDIEFVPNIIIKFTLDKPIEDRIMVKKKVSSAFVDPVKYVDIKEGNSSYYVRCADAGQAKKLSEVKALGEATILTGTEEQAYWDTIRCERAQLIVYGYLWGDEWLNLNNTSIFRQDRQKKREGEVKTKSKCGKKQVRGKERLIIQVEEANRGNHIYFHDDEWRKSLQDFLYFSEKINTK